jgi:hypothetical protein
MRHAYLYSLYKGRKEIENETTKLASKTRREIKLAAEQGKNHGRNMPHH